VRLVYFRVVSTVNATGFGIIRNRYIEFVEPAASLITRESVVVAVTPPGHRLVLSLPQSRISASLSVVVSIVPALVFLVVSF
jgi:hypothetical protein